LKQITYVSTANESVSFDTVLEILDVAHRANEEHDISGMLIYDGKHFLQYFEGEDAKVEALWHNIEKDERHRDVRLLSVSGISDRHYPFWTMGYLNNRPKVTELLQSKTGNTVLMPQTLTGEEADGLLMELSKLL
jgi:hypothetical protein